MSSLSPRNHRAVGVEGRGVRGGGWGGGGKRGNQAKTVGESSTNHSQPAL